VQLACGLPLTDLGSGGGFDEAVGIERDDLHFGATVWAPGQGCPCIANEDKRLGFHRDPGCFACHGSLPLIVHWFIPFSNRRILLRPRVESPQSRPQNFSNALSADFLKKGQYLELDRGGVPGSYRADELSQMAIGGKADNELQ
jgi:hypothetical protein